MTFKALLNDLVIGVLTVNFNYSNSCNLYNML